MAKLDVRHLLSVILINFMLAATLGVVGIFGTPLVLIPGCIIGFFWGRKTNAPTDFFNRYLPFFIPAIIMNVYCILQMINSAEPLELKGFGAIFSVGFYLIVAGFPIVMAVFYSIGVATIKKRIEIFRLWYVLPILIIVTFAGMFGFHNCYQSQLILESDSTESINEEVNLYDYDPFKQGNQLVKADFQPELTFTENYPRLDGATVAYPVYAAIAETLYKGLDEDTAGEYVTCNMTDGAYEQLILGENDVVFGVRPSEEQMQAAKDAGVTFVLTNISKEAFVFFVNKDNPVNDLTVEQIQKIYTKEIKNWDKVGGANDEIVPFQRPVNSGSQTIMTNMVMKGLHMPEPLKEEKIQMMGGIMYQVADYRNYMNAIGFSFRYYATIMNPHAGIKLLSVNGVEPTAANIQNGTYPFTTDVYAVTTETGANKPNVKKLMEWLVSPQGQHMVEQ